MLINLDGNLINYNNVQRVIINAVHVDFLEQNTKCSEKGHEYFEITVMPKIDFEIEYKHPYKGYEIQRFHVGDCLRPPNRNDKTGDSWIGFHSGNPAIPSIDYNQITGNFNWNVHFYTKAWQTLVFDRYGGDHRDIEKPTDTELKDWKLNVRAKIEKHATFFILRALNEAARICRKA